MKLQKFTLTLLFSSIYLSLYAQNFEKFTAGNLLVLFSETPPQTPNPTTNAQSVPISIMEIDRSGEVQQTISIPSTGTTTKLVLSSKIAATVEGLMSLSADSSYVTFIGYDVEVGITNPHAISPPPITIGKLDALGNFSMKTGDFTGGTRVRSVVEASPNKTWTVGGGNTSLFYFDLLTGIGNRTWTTTATPAVNNNNKVLVFNDKIYFSSRMNATNAGIYVVDKVEGEFPTTEASAIPAVKLNLPGLGAAPNSFVIFDTDANGVADLIYVADETHAGGLQKYYFDGTSWTAKGMVTVSGTVGLTGDLTGIYEDNKYIIYGNTGEKIVSFTDSATPGSNIAVAESIVLTASTNQVFRGMSFTPKEITTTPVKLVSFTGEVKEANIKLNWETASERNNSHFEIYRSGNSELLLPVATVSGYGDSRTLKSYSYLDTNPLPGVNYYQLKQVDYDGKSQKSGVIAVNTAIDKELLSVYTKGGHVHAVFYSTANETALVNVTDMAGRTVYNENVKLQTGYNNLSLNIAGTEAVYTLTVYANGKKHSVKFMK